MKRGIGKKFTVIAVAALLLFSNVPVLAAEVPATVSGNSPESVQMQENEKKNGEAEGLTEEPSRDGNEADGDGKAEENTDGTPAQDEGNGENVNRNDMAGDDLNDEAVTEIPGDTTEENGDTTEENGDTTEENGDTTEENGDTTEENEDTTEENEDITEEADDTTEADEDGTEEIEDALEESEEQTEEAEEEIVRTAFAAMRMMRSVRSQNTYTVEDFEEFSAAVEAINAQEAGDFVIELTNDISMSGVLEFNKSTVTIEGKGHSLSRADGHTGGYFSVGNDAELVLKELTVDGGAAEWWLNFEEQYNQSKFVRVPVEYGSDVSADQSLIINKGSLRLDGCVMQNARSSAAGAAISNMGTLNIVGSKFQHNLADTHSPVRVGGAINSGKNSSINISDSEFIGNAAGDADNACGGVISIVYGDSLIIENCTFKDNFAQHDGGAIWLDSTNLSITDSTFEGNIIGNDGAAISISKTNDEEKTCSFERVCFKQNVGMASGQSLGGALYIIWYSQEISIKDCEFLQNKSAAGTIADHGSCTLKITGSRFCENESGSGGALYLQGAVVNMENCVMNDNTAFNGGAVRQVSDSELYLKNTEIKKNNAAIGGALCMQGTCVARMENCVMNDNTASGNGGAVYQTEAGKLYLKNTEVKNNSAQRGGAVALRNSTTDSYEPLLELGEGTVITNNRAAIYGGALYLLNAATVNMLSGSQIYGNTGESYGDDILSGYTAADPRLKLTLLDAEEMNAEGVNGWFEDKKDARYADAENPVEYKPVNEDSSMLFLKAAAVYRISYDGNAQEAENVPDSHIKKHGYDTALAAQSPKREGYIFRGWNTKADGSGTAFQPGQAYTDEADITLYAMWEKPAGNLTVTNIISGNGADPDKDFTFAVTLDDSSINGIYGEMEFINGKAVFTLKGGESKTAEKLPDGVSYTIVESDNEGYDVTSRNETGKIVKDETIDASFQNEIFVVFRVVYEGNADDVKNVPDSQEKPFGGSITISEHEPSREGYVFVGWNTKADGTGTEFLPGQIYEGEADLTLYAVWKSVQDDSSAETESNSGEQSGKKRSESAESGTKETVVQSISVTQNSVADSLPAAQKTDGAATGDDSDIITWISLLMAAVAMLFGLWYIRKNRLKK